MKLRNALGVAAGTVGLTALANRLLTARTGTFEPPLSGTRGTYRWRGIDVEYVEAGDPDDPAVVLLHGVGPTASNAEFHGVVADLAETHHVLAPDLPGFGQSGRPPLLYSASLLTTFVRDFCADHADAPTVVASSLTGAYAAEVALGGDVGELVLVCPTDETAERRRTWRRTLLRSPVVGEGLFNLATSSLALRRRRRRTYHDPGSLPTDVREYEWATSHQSGARFAPASLYGGFLDPEESLPDVLADLEVPVTLVWGRGATEPPLSAGRDLAEAGDDRLVVFEDAKSLPHAEHPDAFVDVVRGEYENVAAP